MRPPATLVALVLFATGSQSACEGTLRGAPDPSSEVIAEAPAPSEPATVPAAEEGYDDKRAHYPRREWSLAPTTLNTVAFNLAHIRISHAEVRSHGMFQYQSPSRGRTLADALTLARRLAKELAAHPEKFAEYAETYSDDAVTRTWGGAMGLVRATGIPPEVVDAMYVLEPGEISRPIVTTGGVEIIKRLPPPPKQPLAAREILIKWDGALGRTRDGREIRRSHEDARSLAERVFREATAEQRAPGLFADLVERYSDAYDASDGGDTGVLSTWDAGARSLAVRVISTLQVGEVSKPVETPLGFSIYLRTDEVKRVSLAASEIRIAYEGATGGISKRPLKEAIGLAKLLCKQLRVDPALFDSLRHAHCEGPICRQKVHTWQQGAGFDAVEEAILGVELGALVGAPVVTPTGVLVLRREQPEATASSQAEQLTFAPPRFETLVPLLERSSGAALGFMVEKHGEAFVASKRDSAPETIAALEKIFEGLTETAKQAPPEARLQAYQQSRARLEATLGADGLASYDVFVKSWIRAFTRVATAGPAPGSAPPSQGLPTSSPMGPT